MEFATETIERISEQLRRGEKQSVSLFWQQHQQRRYYPDRNSRTQQSRLSPSSAWKLLQFLKHLPCNAQTFKCQHTYLE